jgi:arginine repressor
LYNIEESADFNSNKATYSKYLRDLERIKEVSLKKPYYYKLPKYQKSEFKFIEKDLKKIDHMGRIMDNSNSMNPLAVFNTDNFGVFEFRDKQ